ncbi:hypothetical protein TNCV_4703461 [Trichonephila clavipes]|nr:hypothetical protein TNCV_4703461 [Trichonephila clavipes]
MTSFAMEKNLCVLQCSKMLRERIFGYVYSLWLMPQLQNDIDNCILQLDGVPQHWSVNVRDYLDEHLPHRWNARVMDYNMPLTQCLSRSPDPTLWDFFQWGM